MRHPIIGEKINPLQRVVLGKLQLGCTASVAQLQFPAHRARRGGHAVRRARNTGCRMRLARLGLSGLP